MNRQQVIERIRDALLSLNADADLSETHRLEAQRSAELAVREYTGSLRWISAQQPAAQYGIDPAIITKGM